MSRKAQSTNKRRSRMKSFYGQPSRSQPTRRRRKPVYRKSFNSKGYRAVKGLKKQVKQLSRLAKADQGTLIYRKRNPFDVQSLANQQTFVGVPLNSLIDIETVLAELRYYDPSNPAVLITADGAVGSFSKDFYFNKSYHHINIRNNYQVPVNVRLYIYKVKEDTALSPSTCYISGLVDIGGLADTSPLAYPSDSHILNEVWSVAKSSRFRLNPGNERSISYLCKKFTYDPSVGDTHSLEYQRSFDGSYFAIRIEGVSAHDPIADEQGISPAGVDVIINSTWEILYPAGGDIKFIVANDTSDAFSNSALVTNKPIADNQTYSKL